MEAGQRASVALHTSPLTDPVDRAGLRAFRPRLRARLLEPPGAVRPGTTTRPRGRLRPLLRPLLPGRLRERRPLPLHTRHCARFIDHAAEFDVEIVDVRLYLYSRRDLSTLDPETWVWLWATLDALTDKIARWERWRDGRIGSTTELASEGAQSIVRPPRGVAPAGRRLHRRSQWIWVVIALAFVAVFGFNFFFAILRSFW